MATSYHLFPDGREEPKNINRATAWTGIPASATRSVDTVLVELRSIDWAHPALVVYREDGDDRWSYVMVGLNTPEGLGEGDG